MKKFDSDFSYMGCLKEKLCEPLYLYMGYLIVYCDKEDDTFEKISKVFEKYNDMDSATIDYFIKLILFYIKRRIYTSAEDTVVKQIESVIKHYSSFASCMNSKLDAAFDAVNSFSLDCDNFDDSLKDIVSKFFKHFGCSEIDCQYKDVYDTIDINDVSSIISVSEKNGIFGENEIFLFDNQFLLDIDNRLVCSTEPYDQLKNDIIRYILLHIGYLYFNSSNGISDDNYLRLGELLENIDEVVEMFLIKMVNLYIALSVTKKKSGSYEYDNKLCYIEKMFGYYGFDFKKNVQDLESVCDEYVSMGELRMLDINCEKILKTVFSYFGLNDAIPGLSSIVDMYRDLGFVFSDIDSIYKTVLVNGVDMINKIPFISPSLYNDDRNYKKIPSFFGKECTYKDLAREVGLNDAEIIEKVFQLAEVLKYYDAGISSVYGNLFPFVWMAGRGIYMKTHGFDILRFMDGIRLVKNMSKFTLERTRNT